MRSPSLARPTGALPPWVLRPPLRPPLGAASANNPLQQRCVVQGPHLALKNNLGRPDPRRSIAARASNGGPAEDADTVDVTETVQVVAEELADAAAAAAPEFAPRKKLVVLGGNGFVGSAVCREALQMGLPVVSVNRCVSCLSACVSSRALGLLLSRG